ncbi:MAG TPA: hypothetical protein VHS96_08745 [Bacteroidia bacterium]|nr:hypothetical protein [Bacteroidia bacterium]
MVIYLAVLVRPILPMLLFQANQQQIAASFCIQKDIKDNCCKGKCFLRNSLQAQEDRHGHEPLSQLLEEEQVFTLTTPQAVEIEDKLSAKPGFAFGNEQVKRQVDPDLAVPPPWWLPTVA